MRLHHCPVIFPFLLGASTLFAQDPGGFGCGTDQARSRLIAADPHLEHAEADLEAGLQAYLQAMAGLRSDEDTVVYHIPIVFHVLYDPTTSSDNHNLPDQWIYDAVALLNEDYRKLNADTSVICCGFNSIAADSRIQFDLATKDPFGQCTNGIDRVTTQRSSLAGDFSKVNGWPRDRYVNIWVVNSMADAGVAGYAYYPADAQDALGALRDGVAILSSSLVSFALVHEVGHYLNLQHVWGNTNNAGVACGDDGVEDTPITKGYNLTCPGPVNNDICTPGVHENYQNYMDYSYCSVMYTNGQRDRMRATLNSNVSGRSNLWQPANRDFTGIQEAQTTCAPEPDFYTLNPFVCPGVTVQLKANVKRATATSWNWAFEGGTPATSTEQHPTVSFSTPGSHAITLTAGNAFGENTITKDHAVTIGSDWSEVNGLLNQAFNNLPDFWSWPVINYEDNSSYWGWTDQVGHDAPGCAKLNASETYDRVQDIFAGNTLSDKDILMTPVLDLQNVSSVQLSFWYAYKTRTSEAALITESLEIAYSTDCGKTWLVKDNISGGELVTAGLGDAGYLPLPGDWREVTLNMGTVIQQDHVRIRFRYASGLFSNDLFLDDVRINGSVGVPELAGAAAMSLAPNPATEQVRIDMDLAGAPATLTLRDALGRPVHQAALPAGTTSTTVDLRRSAIAPGLYQVELDNGRGTRTAKLVVR
jgi:PKD repeat protein